MRASTAHGGGAAAAWAESGRTAEQLWISTPSMLSWQESQYTAPAEPIA